MSIIRQRSKNLLVSGMIGFFCALIVMMILYITVVRGNVTVIEFILKDSQLEVTTRSEEPEEVIEKTGVYLLTQGVKKDEIIRQEMLKKVEFVKELVPPSAILSILDIVNQKAIISLDENIILTRQMLRKPELAEVMLDMIEVQNVHIPEVILVGDKISLRVHFPTGQDYRVVEGKEVLNIDEVLKTFCVSLTEEEILSYSSAREDVNLYPGTILYLTKEDHSIIVSETMSESGEMDYVDYPLNPNSLQLSKYFDSSFVLEHRRVLDSSLLEFFDQDENRFVYEINRDLAGQSETGQNTAAQSTESQSTDSQSTEGQNTEGQNIETQNQETQISGSQGTETQSSGSQGTETQSSGSQGTETQISGSQGTETQNTDSQNQETGFSF